MNDAARELDLVLFGATGFTGRLAAAHLAERHPPGSGLSYGLAARNGERLDALAASLGLPSDAVPRIVADASDPASLASLVRRTRVVATVVGPYRRYGEPLVAACADHGTGYCDLAGEVPFMHAMIERHGQSAKRSGARIVHACGFDSVPSDLGCLLAVRAVRERHDTGCREVTMIVKRLKGEFSGGTYASALGVVEAARRDRTLRRMLADPYALSPETTGGTAAVDDQTGPRFDRHAGLWTAPFVMGPVNSRVVVRSHELVPGGYGEHFTYRECVAVGRGAKGWARAAAVSAGLAAFTTAAAFGPTRRLIERRLPAPGEGPDEAARARGRFELLVQALPERTEAPPVWVRVAAERDPGYECAAGMLIECAAALASGSAAQSLPGGFWTPASAFGPALADALAERVGIDFDILP